MPKIAYKEMRIGADRLRLIETANEIIASYQAQGYELTLRQLYYQFVSRDIIPNTMREYKNLGDVINDGRMTGLVDWDAIVDRTRSLAALAHWDSPAEIIESCARQFRHDKWKDQERRIEVWVEKEALAGIVERVCVRNDVPFLCCRGYTSQSEMWGAAMRLKRFIRDGQEPYIIHLGDHDPSGIDMTRDIVDRLELFVGQRVELKRIALNRDQVDQYEPPPNPAKITDSRATKYIEEHGAESWELDALEPSVLDRLIQDEIYSVRDAAAWERAERVESKERGQIASVSEKWADVVKGIKKRP